MFVVPLLLVLVRGDSLFAAWLSQIKVELPEQMTEQAAFSVGLTDIVCGDFAVESLPSAYLPPLRFTIAGTGLSFDCNMRFTYKNMYFPYIPSGSGQVRVRGTESWIQLALSLALLAGEEYPLPGAVSVDDCTAKLTVSDLDLPQLGLGETVSSIISIVIRSSVELLLPTVICEEVSMLIQQNLTFALGLLNEYTLPMLHFPLAPSLLPSTITLPPHAFNWHSTVFQLITAALDEDGVAEIRHIMDENGFVASPQGSQGTQWCELTSNIEGPGINTLMDIATNEQGEIAIETALGPFEVLQGVVSVSIDQVNVTGLRTFQNFSLLRTIDTNFSLVDDYVLTTLMKLPNLQVLLGGTVQVRFDDALLHERALLNISLRDMTVYLSSVTVLDLDRFGKLFVGQLSDVSCWLSTFAEMNVTDSGMLMQLEASLPPLQENGVEKDLALAVTQVLALIKQDFGSSLSRAISGWAAYYRTVFNQDFVNGTYGCADMVAATGDIYLDWRANSHPLAWVDDLLTAILVDGIMTVTIHNGSESSIKGPPALNGLVDCLTVGEAEAGSYIRPGSLFVLRLGSGEEQFELELRDLALAGLDTFEHLRLFAPVASDPLAVHLGFMVGNCSEIGRCNPLKVGVVVSVRVSTRATVANLSLSMEEFDLDLQLHAPLNTRVLNQLRVDDLQSLQCALSVFPSLAIQSLAMSVQSLLADLRIDSASPERFDVTHAANQLLSALPTALVRFLNTQLASVVHEAPFLCRGQVPSSSLPESAPPSTAVVIGVVALSLAAVLAVAMVFGSRARSKVSPARELAPDNFTLQDSFPPRQISYPLSKHPRLPLAVRVCVPMVLLCAIIILITAHVSSGARVTLWISSEGSSPELLATVSEFTLAVSVADMWSAGVPLLAVLVALLSGFWPYIKLFSMLLCWFLPPSKLPTETRRVNRGCVLGWLHTLGKWSLIDAFVLAVMMVAFRFHISPHAALPFLDASLFLDVTLEPEWGITGFILATLVSMLMSDVCVWAHRKAENIVAVPPPSAPRTVLWREALKGVSPRRRQGAILGLGVLAGAAVMLPVAIVGLDLLGFQFSGLVSLVMNPNQRQQSFTGAAFGSSMLPASLLGGFDPWLLKWTFVLHAIIVPIFHALAVCMLLFAPLSPRHLVLLNRGCALLSSWACLDVLLASLLGGLLQLGLVAEYLVGDFCRPVDSALEVLGISTPNKPLSCFGVQAEFRAGLFILILTTALFQAASFVTSKMVASRAFVGSQIETRNELQERN